MRLLAVASFEALFEVPPEHRLVQVRSRSRGGTISGTFLEHEEYDPGGQLIARFETFEETGPTGRTTSGWRRYDQAGRLVNAGDLRPAAAPSAGSRARSRPSSEGHERQP